MTRANVTRIKPSAGYTLSLRVRIEHVPGNLGRLTSAIGRAGGLIEAVDLVEHRGRATVREILVQSRNEDHGREIVRHVKRVHGVEVVSVSDRTFDLHAGGKISVQPKYPLRTRDDLSMAYTPGVGRVCQAIADEPRRVWDLTIKRNSVAVLTDGTAVLGLGHIGPEAALPVMEGKAMLFKELAGIDAYPLCVRTTGPEELVALAKAVSPGFGGINLEDVAAPACFEVEARLQEELDVPVFHDDQHGTAVVVLASMLNAARAVGKRLEEMKVVVLGMGAAGVACARLMLLHGVGDVLGLDRAGILHPDRPGLGGQKRWIADNTNRKGLTGGLETALVGADAFVGVSGPGLVQPEWLAGMAPDAIVFALANPVPEIMPEEVPPNVAVVATGRSDYPNQINNVLVFPGLFRGLLDSRARKVDDSMKVAAASALAGLVGEEELSPEYVIPSIFDDRVVPAMARAVREAAVAASLARVDD